MAQRSGPPTGKMIVTPTRLGQNLYKHRHANHLSLADLARKANIDATYIGQLERGQRNPSLGMMNTLAEALGVPLAQLLS